MTKENNLNMKRSWDVPLLRIRKTVTRLAQKAFQLVLNILFSSDLRAVKQLFINGRCQFIFTGEHVGRKIALRIFERRETQFFFSYLKPGQICLDVGANVGYYTNLFAERIGTSGRVIAVEPVYRNTLLITMSSTINGTDSYVSVVNAAISDSDISVTISRGGDSSYANIEEADSGQPGKIKALTLDSLVRTMGITHIDVIKMDIEGWEYHALKGMQNILTSKELRPRLMMIELFADHLQKYGSSIDQICSHLAILNYRPYVLDRTGSFIPFSTEHHNKFYNVFFLDGNK